MLSRQNACLLHILIIDKWRVIVWWVTYVWKKKKSTNFCLEYIKYMRMQIKEIIVKTSIFVYKMLKF